MRNARFLVAVACVILTAAFRPTVAQQQTKPATLVVTVGDADSRAFLADIEVRLAGTPITTRTDAFGEATLTGIPAGAHEVDARKLGYIPRAVAFTARDGDTLRLLLLLKRSVRPLDTVRVSALARKAFLLGFEERRQSTRGYFLNQDQLDSTSWLNDLPTALARRLPWLGVGEDSHGLPYLRTTHRATCGPIEFLDGRELIDRTEIWTIMARELAGVEFYDEGSRAPGAFRRPRSGVHLCSIMLLWSR